MCRLVLFDGHFSGRREIREEFMKRITWLILLALLISGSMLAQPRTSITIGSNLPYPTPNGPVFIVDGTSYISTQVFEWIQGTSHVVQFPLTLDPETGVTDYQSAQNDNIRFLFGGWTANTNLFPTPSGTVVEVTADPSLTSLIASVTVNYLVNIVFQGGTGAGNPSCTVLPTTPPAGAIYLNQQCFADSSQVYLPAGTLNLAAVAYPGWVFYDWLVNNQPLTSLTSFNLTAPMMIIPQFSLAKRVDFLTNPLGLRVLVDGSPVNTPPAGTAASAGGTCAPDYTRLPVNAPAGFQPLCYGQFDFLPGSTHTIGASTPQSDAAGNYWIFSGWSNGLGQNANYTVDFNTSAPAILTANFIPGVRVSILSNPGAMKIMIDGRDNWLDYNFVWGQGSTHTLSAETPQMQQNRMFQFAAWSDGGAAAHAITVPAAYGFSVTASYTKLPQITINSSPSGLNITVDGSSCSTPCVVNKASGSQSTVVIPSSIPVSPGARFDFIGWSDGSSASARTVNFNQDTLTLTANYQTSFQVTESTAPANAGTFTLTPPSPDGFYASGTVVTVSAVANGGFKFAHWSGDLAGSTNSGALTMNSPHSVIADFATVPYIPPTGIQSVTGPTPDGSIAPGSIMSIYGQNLAPSLLVGLSNPLQQAIGTTTVTVGNDLLALVFVSPGQIGAQVPWELAPGPYTLTVHNSSLPDVSGTFTVTRDAPGIFLQANPQNLPMVLAVHADGTLVNTASPAVQGEQITIYGTGFGPYTQTSVDGFAASPAANFTVADPVLVTCGATQTTPDFAGAAPGMVGVAIVKLTISPDMAIAGNANLTVAVNGKPSAAMVLPIQ
jgi:uncharacterized protein (TIGR03437 family)